MNDSYNVYCFFNWCSHYFLLCGQQVLSPYHAMGCNPAMMVDPLGLQALTMNSPHHGGVAPPGYMVEGNWVTVVSPMCCYSVLLNLNI